MSDILLAFALVGLTMFGALILVGLHAALAGERRVHVYRRLPAPGGSTGTTRAVRGCGGQETPA